MGFHFDRKQAASGIQSMTDHRRSAQYGLEERLAETASNLGCKSSLLIVIPNSRREIP
jgi:hypothetical protein